MWTVAGVWMVGHFGLGLLLRVALNSHRDLGFWAWFLVVSLVALGYGIARARQDGAAGITHRPVTPAQGVVLAGLAVYSTIIVFLTDNHSSRLLGRAAVAALVGVCIALDILSRARSDLSARRP